MTRAHKEPSYAQVLSDFFVLRQAIQLNRMDTDLKASNIQIVYFVDPSLVELYVEPASWSKRLAAFPSLSPDGTDGGAVKQRDTPAEINALRATALLTGEYIFSHALVGTFGDLFVTPDHFTELLGYIQKVEGQHFQAVREFEKQIENKPDLADRVVNLMRTSQALKKAGMGGARSVEPWRRALVQALGEVTTENLVVTRRLFDLLEQRLLANASIRDDFTLDILAPSQERVRHWTSEIRKAKSGNRRPNSPDAIEADAVTLEQLWLLNEASKDARYVLITDDAGLHATYQKMCRQASGPTFNALRRPIQYTPILNLQDMPGRFGANGTFQKIEAGVESIAQTFTSSDEPEDNEHIVAFLSDAMPSVGGVDGRLNSLLVGMAAEIRNDWKQLVHFASSAKADFLEQGALADDEYWTLFVHSRSFRQRFSLAATSFKEEAVTLSASSSLLRYEIWALHAAGDGGKGSPDDFSRRQLATTFAEFESTTLRGKSLLNVVEEWMEAGASAIEALKLVEIRSERLLCVGALCLQIGAWGAAFRLLHEASDVLSASALTALRDEIQFFQAVAARLSANDRNWHARRKQAEASLSFLRRRRLQEPFTKARLESEGIALALCQLPWLYAEGERQQISNTLQEVENHAVDFLKNRLAALMNPSLTSDGKAVIRQICLNVFCLTAWRSIHDLDVRPQSRALYEEYNKLFSVAWMSEFARGPHVETYPALAEIAITRDLVERDELRRRVTETIDRLVERDVAYSFAFDMPAVDKKEFSQFKLWLERLPTTATLPSSDLADAAV